MIAIIGMLVALLLPAVQSVRAAAQRASCQNNQRQLALGLLGYHDAKGKFPQGLTGFLNGASPRGGDSWFVYLMPFIEEMTVASVYQKVTNTNGTGIAFNNNASVSSNRLLLNNLVLASLRCPASSLSPLISQTGIASSVPASAVVNLQRADYVGISGATDGFISGGGGSFTETRNQTSTSSACNGGVVSGGGVLFPNSAVKIAQILDGTAATLILSEVSDNLVDTSGVKQDWRSPYGWATGYMGSNTSNVFNVPPNWAAVQDLRTFNTVTIRYAINKSTGWSGSSSDGVCADHGNNQPLRSAHPGGVLGAFCDGSVRFLPNTTSMAVLAQLATRDDGTIIADAP